MPNKAARAACSPPLSNPSRERLAQRIDNSIDLIASSRLTPLAGHSSNAMTMSEPNSRWISIDRSGDSICFDPSRWLWNATPSSVILRKADRLIT
jgi:hypothetical protein